MYFNIFVSFRRDIDNILIILKKYYQLNDSLKKKKKFTQFFYLPGALTPRSLSHKSAAEYNK
jgi:hypothetical protein